MTRSNIIDLALIRKAETSAAILVSDGTRSAWLPKSQIEIEDQPDGSIIVSMPEWLAIDKEFV